FLEGLPYILGASNPKDPKDGWAKTWDYLAELGKNIEYYPTGTGAVMKELAEGSRDMIASHLGWDLNPRILGVVPKEAEIGTLEGFHWVTDAQYWAIPKGVSNDKLAVLLKMTEYMLSKPAQAMTYDKGYFYPGPAVKDVPLSMAPQASQDAVGSVRRGFIDKLIADVPSEVPLPADKLVYAFQRWDPQVGARVGKYRRMPIASRDFRELRLEGVGRDFGQLRALRNVNLTVKRGEFVALLGPSGCGKSTALNCISGLLQPTDGAIWLDDRRLDDIGPEDRGFGMVFQNYALFPHMTVRRNIGFGLTTHRRPRDEIERRVYEALALVRLETQAEKLPGQLSGGQQQRVAIARAIVVETPLVLMDEPLSNLDAKLRLEIRAEIRCLHQ